MNVLWTRAVGLAILLLSLPVYSMTATALFLVAIGGWTSDNPNQPLLEHLFGRLLAAAFFMSNIALSFAGIRILRRQTKALTFVLLILGAWSAIYFYGGLYGNYSSVYSRLQRGDARSVVAEYSKEIERGTGTDTYGRRGDIYYGTGEYQKALADFKAAKDYKSQVLTYLKLSDVGKAAEACEAWAADQPDTASRAFRWKGNVLYRHGLYKEAVEAHQKSAQLKQRFNSGMPWLQDGADVMDCIYLSSCYAELGDFAGAKSYIEAAKTVGKAYLDKTKIDVEIKKALEAESRLADYLQRGNRPAGTAPEVRPRPKDADPTRMKYDDMGEMDYGLPTL